MKNKKTAWSHVTDRPWKRVAIILALLAAIFLIPLGVVEYNDQQVARKLSSAIYDFGQTALKPLGGVEVQSAVTCSHVTDFVYSLETGPCPRAGASWLVPVPKNDTGEFISSIIQKARYTGRAVSSSQGGAGKNGVEISIEVLPGVLGGNEPHAAPTGTEWRTVNLDTHR